LEQKLAANQRGVRGFLFLGRRILSKTNPKSEIQNPKSKYG
jgi:hypothetical protein